MSYVDFCAAGREVPKNEEAVDEKALKGPPNRKPKMTLTEAKNGAINYRTIIMDKPKKELVVEYFKQRIMRDLDESDEDEDMEEDEYVDEVKPKKKKGKKN